MGLLDILNGMQNGPRGQTQPTQPGQSKGMSPLMMALLGLLAYKALKGSGGLGSILGGSPSPQPVPAPSPSSGGLGDILGGLLGGAQPGSPAGQSTSGGLGDILGGLLGGTTAGPALNGGLRSLLEDLEQNGHGEVAKSWVASGENRSIAPNDLANALGADTVSTLSSQTGMSRDDLLAELSRNLPHLVDQLTPDGRLPTEQEASRW
jgi:uncharacterized protein YidB (DUF937 family)